MSDAMGLASGLLIAGGLRPALAAEGKSGKPAPSKWTITDPEALAKVSSLRQSLYNCVKTGEACQEHCREQLAKGETMFADCSASIAQMLAVCKATAELATLKSVRLKEILSVCLSACQSCKEACDAHSAHWKHGMHLVCKECSEACAAVIADIKKTQESLSA